MRKIKEVLRLRFELGLGQRQIARSCGMGLGTVHEYLERAVAAGIGWLNEETYLSKIQPLLAGITNKAVASALGSAVPYASAIRAGRRVPHPRHWQALAELVGVSADFLKDGLAGHSPVSTNGAQKNGLS